MGEMNRAMLWKSWLAMGLGIAACGWALAGFAVPSKHDRVGAVGELDGLDPAMRRAFTDSGEFEAKKAPEPSDWLAAHKEAGQTFGQYLKARPNIPNDRRAKLYLLPLGKFAKGKAPDIGELRDYSEAYFYPLKVVILPEVGDSAVPTKARVNSFSGRKQWKSTDILRWLPEKLPGDAYAMIAVTMTDLYPDESWNFVFGQASLRNRVGVFSFARYHPGWRGREADDGTDALVLRRAAKVLTHETGHMFGIRHCIYYECNMNGANHLGEADATPMHLCPVCLRKMQHATGFDPATRYRKLRAFYQKHGLEPEKKWVDERMKRIGRSEKLPE